MAQNLLDRLDESIGMEEHDLGRDISDAAMQRGISPVEMRAQLLQTMLQEDGKTISDKDVALFAMGEIGLAEAVKRSTVDRTLRTDVKALSERVQKGIAGLRPKMEDFSEYMFGVPSYIDAEAGMGRTLSDLDQVQALAADSGRTVSDRDVLNMLQEGRTLSDQDLSGRTLSNQDLAIGRTMSDQDLSGRTLSDVDVEAETLSVDEQLSQLHELLNEHRRTLSDADRRFLQEMSWAIGINSYTPSDQDRQIIQDIQGRILSDSDAAIIEMLK